MTTAMNQQQPLQPRGMIAFGLLFVAVGAFVVYMALGGAPDSSLHAPRWVASVAGLMFSFAGLLVIVNALAGAPDGEIPASAPFWLRLVQQLLVLAIFVSFGLVFSWVAFGPGERHFSVSTGLLSSHNADEVGGRVAFGIGAVLIWLATVFVAMAGLRKLRRRDD